MPAGWEADILTAVRRPSSPGGAHRRVAGQKREGTDSDMTVEAAPRTVIRTSPGFFVNSLIAATLAVVFSRLIEQLGIAIGGAFLGREPVFTNVTTELGAAGSDTVYLGATIASLVSGISFLLLYPGAKDRSAGKLMVLWMTLFSFRNAFVDMAFVPLSERSFLGRALGAFELPPGIDLVVAVAGVAGIILVALAAAPAFLGFNRHLSEVYTAKDRLRYVATIAVVPGVVAPLLAVLFFVPDGSGYLAGLPLAGIFTVVTLLAAPGTKRVSAPKVIEERMVSWGLVGTAVAVLVLVHILFQPGVPIPPWNEDLSFRFRP